MIKLNDHSLDRIAKILEKKDLKSTVSLLGGLLVDPSLQANTIRIETLVHLAVLNCRGDQRPHLSEISHWMNSEIGRTWVVQLEDPVENVFVTNVLTTEGNRRIFEGIWEANDYYTQVIIEVLASRSAPKACRDLLIPIFEMLKLSDFVAEQAGLQRGHFEPSSPKGKVRLESTKKVEKLSHMITFSNNSLDMLGIKRESLAPFIISDNDKNNLAAESIGNSSLERCPLIDFGDELILALPHAVSPAIRRFVLSELARTGYLHAFGEVIANHQAEQVANDCLWELKGKADSLEPPSPVGTVPSLHAWLLKYDINKYLHVVLLHDRMEWLLAQGLSSFFKYPEQLKAGLEQYLNDVANYCMSLTDYTEGMTLLVLGGLGRGFSLGFKDWPDQWHLSHLRISDMLMLAIEHNQSISRYLKCIRQKDWAERRGVFFQDLNEDYNFYCYWRQMNYQLIPRELPVSNGSVLMISNDMVLPIRQEVRNQVDRHAIETIDGSYLPSVRFGKDAFFKSIQNRPIYVSLDHLNKGILAGVVETSRGPSWFRVESRASGKQITRVVYEIWDGFIILYEKLVLEVEALYSENSTGPIEICLNLDNIVVSEDFMEPQSNDFTVEPAIDVDVGKRKVVIRFPSDFLKYFQQAENVGEKLVLRCIAKGLIIIHQGGTNGVDEALDYLMNRIISDPGIRVIHLFRTYYPINYLLARKNQKPVFIAHEDFVFSKLMLSDGCITVADGESITSKSECNKFLHRVVDKVWHRIKGTLRTLDRESVIREMLLVHEAVISDREHWRRTAQAVLALYASAENVFAVAQERESDRNNVSLSARTILEMAICESPKIGGCILSECKRDELLALALLLIEVATDSDAVNGDLTEPRINLNKNGEYSINRDFHDTIVKPFLTAYLREEFEVAAGQYHKLYEEERPSNRTRADEVYSSDFISAFKTEYGLTPDETIDGFAELMDLAVEQDSVVVETTLGDIRKRLNVNRGLSSDIREAFICAFSIFHRREWDKAPPGFRNKDVYPWRFRRRLSLVSKPILIFGVEDDDKVIYGAGGLRLGLGYLLERSERGHLPEEFFTSSEMKRYIGTVNNERGHDFARSVANQMNNKGWIVRYEVQMTELGAASEYGDVDVLAWKPTGEVLLIECKRLQLARTVAEVAEICRRFQGAAEDELDRHVRRVKWIRANHKNLRHITGFVPDPVKIDDMLVTNIHVPMMYLTSLPIAAEKIGPLK